MCLAHIGIHINRFGSIPTLSSVVAIIDQSAYLSFALAPSTRLLRCACACVCVVVSVFYVGVVDVVTAADVAVAYTVVVIIHNLPRPSGKRRNTS